MDHLCKLKGAPLASWPETCDQFKIRSKTLPTRQSEVSDPARPRFRKVMANRDPSADHLTEDCRSKLGCNSHCDEDVYKRHCIDCVGPTVTGCETVALVCRALDGAASGWLGPGSQPVQYPSVLDPCLSTFASMVAREDTFVPMRCPQGKHADCSMDMPAQQG